MTMYKLRREVQSLAKYKLIVAILVCYIFSLLYIKPIINAQASTQQGINITPSTQNITLESHQPVYRATLILTNRAASRVDLEMSAQDFGGVDEGGGLLFLGTNPNEKWDAHRLVDWIDIKPKKFKLDPQEQIEVIVEIRNDNSLGPGGHYAAIIATVASKEEKSFIAINQSLSSLMFINKIGGESYGIEAKNIEPQAAWWGQVEEVSTRLANTGNAHVVPRGTISVHDPFQRPVASGFINRESTILLPGTGDTFKASLEQVNPPLWPGNYTLVLAYRYDGQDAVYTAEQKVFSLGIVATASIILAITAGLAWFVKILLPKILRQNHNNSAT